MHQEELEVRDGTLTIRVESEDWTKTLAVSGELDLANAETLASELRKAKGEEVAVINLDMSELQFIDSTGIAVLVSAHRDLDESGTALRVVPSRSSAVQRVLSVTGLDAELPFVDTD
jgi:anti-anti-sigma factor